MRAVSGFGIGMLGCGTEIIGFTAVVAVGTMGIVARGKDVRCKRLCVKSSMVRNFAAWRYSSECFYSISR